MCTGTLVLAKRPRPLDPRGMFSLPSRTRIVWHYRNIHEDGRAICCTSRKRNILSPSHRLSTMLRIDGEPLGRRTQLSFLADRGPLRFR